MWLPLLLTAALIISLRGDGDDNADDKEGEVSGTGVATDPLHASSPLCSQGEP